MMKIELMFEDLPENITDVTVRISVEDQLEADAPARRLYSTSVGPLTGHRVQPEVTLEVDIPPLKDVSEPVLMIRAEACTQSHQPLRFLNTTATPLPQGADESVRVVLSRIV